MSIADFRLALRWIRRRPGVWILAVVSLSLGIFANVSLLGMLTPILRLHESDRVHVAWCLVADEYQGFSDAEYLHFRQNSTLGEDIAARVPRMQSVAADGPSEIRPIAEVSSNYFRVVRHEPLLGGAFAPGSDSPGGGSAVVLEGNYWESRFGGNADVLDQSLEVNQKPHPIVGVFRNAAPLDAQNSGWSVAKYRRERTDGDHVLLVRLAADVSAAALEAELNQLHGEYIRQAGVRDKCRSIYLETLRDAVLDGHFRELPPVRPRLLALLAILLFILALAVANYTSLVLARARARAHEVAIRRALGATNLRLTVQFFVEGLVVAIPSCALGVGVAYLVHPQVIQLVSGLTGVIEAEFSLMAAASWGVLLGLVCALIATLPSGLSVCRRGLVPGRDNQPGRGAGFITRLGAPRFFIAGQCAMAYVLLVLAVLTVFSSRQLGNAQLGFESGGLFLAELRLPLEGYVTRVDYEGARRFEVLPDMAQYAWEMPERLRGLPSVSAVGLMQRFDIEGSFEYFRLAGQGPFTRENAVGYEAPKSQSAAVYPVNPQFFESLGVRLLRGRFFTKDDQESGRHVAVISESMARRYWPHRSPIGERLQVVHASVENFQDLPFSEIVGVIEDLQFNLESSNRRRAIFIPHSQLPTGPQMLLVARVYLTLLVRHESSLDTLAGPVREIIGDRDRSVTLERLEDVDQALRAPYAKTFLFSKVMAVLAATGILLAIIGVYGITAFTVLRRGTEFCVRKALGASQHTVLREAVSVNLKTGFVGLVLGLLLTIFLARALTELLPGFLGMSFGVAALAAALILGSLMLASLVPALRTYRLDPASLLRMDTRSDS